MGDDTEVSEIGPLESLVMLMMTAELPFNGAAVTVGSEKTTLEGFAAPTTTSPTKNVDALARTTAQQTKIRFTSRYYQS